MIYVTGDTHRTDLLYIHNFCDNHPELTKNDYIIIAGDFGGVWAKETLERDLKPFSDLPVTVLFVDGNHENFDLINAYPVEVWNGGKVHKIKPDIIHLMRGQVFEIDGKTIFTFGGATSIDRDYRVEGESWWAGEAPTYEELDEGLANLKRYGNKVDYIITHSCGQRALMYPQLRIAASIKTACPESHLLSNFEDLVEFKHWYFGHFHVDATLSDKYTALLHNVVGLNDKTVKYKISVLGDSISAYEGYNPPENVYYDEAAAYENGLLSVDDTWWKMVIDGLEGEICENNSYSGSLVFGEGETSASSEARCSHLHKYVAPDIILVFMGTNDRGRRIALGKFYDAYCTMLKRIKKNYPAAKIVCATLLVSYNKRDGEREAEKYVAEFDYNNAIRAAVEKEGCILADIASSGKCYETLDDVHPTKDGHRLIADLWLESLTCLKRS